MNTKSERTPALDEIDDEHYDCKDKQNMDEAAKRVRTDQAKEPKYQQNYKYSPEHNFLSVEL
jgi:hypothetical protein